MINDYFPHEQLLPRQRFPCAYSGIVNVKKDKECLEQHVLKEQSKS
jgi:hypothetical protein